MKGIVIKMKALVFIACLITAFIIVVIFLYPIPPSLPDNLNKIVTWEQNKVRSLYLNTLKCGEIPAYKLEEDVSISKWRKTCTIVHGYWEKTINTDKEKEAVETAKRIFKNK